MSDDDGEDDLEGWEIALIVLGVLLALLVLFCCCFCLCCRYEALNIDLIKYCLIFKSSK